MGQTHPPDNPNPESVMRCFTVVLVGLVLSAGAAVQAAAQGASIEGGVGLAEGASSFQVGLRGTTAKAGGVGFNLSAATYVDGLTNGVFNVVADAGVEYRPRLSETATASVRAGGSAILASASGLTGSAGGFHLGGGVIVQLGASAGFRIDYTYRLLFESGEHASLSSVTFGVYLGH